MVCEEKSAFNLIIGFLFCFIGDFFFLTVSRIFSLSLIFNIFYYNLFLNLSSFILIQVLVELTDILFEVLYEISEVSGSQFFFFFLSFLSFGIPTAHPLVFLMERVYRRDSSQPHLSLFNRTHDIFNRERQSSACDQHHGLSSMISQCPVYQEQ